MNGFFFRLRDYLFSPLEEKGRVYPFSRASIVAAIAIALLAMLAIVLTARGAFMAALCCLIGIAFLLCFIKERRLVLGTALVLAAFRCALGIVLVPGHAVELSAATTGLFLVAFLLFKSADALR